MVEQEEVEVPDEAPPLSSHDCGEIAPLSSGVCGGSGSHGSTFRKLSNTEFGSWVFETEASAEETSVYLSAGTASGWCWSSQET